MDARITYGDDLVGSVRGHEPADLLEDGNGGGSLGVHEAAVNENVAGNAGEEVRV